MYYGTIERSVVYFTNKLRCAAWNEAPLNEKEAALYEATIAIDRLNFKGAKTDPDQFLQWPRNDLDIPIEIEFATYELAMRLLDGVDVEAEIIGEQILTNTMGTIKNTKKEFSHDHIHAGIPSYRAWTYLKPFLRQGHSIRIDRVD